MLGDPLPLAGVPEGCVARPVLVEDQNGGGRLPRDRSGRVKLTTVELTAVIDSHPTVLPAGADRPFLLDRQTRRWRTIVEHYGATDAAWSAAVTLCREGFVTLTCTVTATRLGLPTRWRWTEATRTHAEMRRKRAADASEAAREVLQRDDGLPAWVDAWLEDVTKSGLLARSAVEGEALLTAAASCLAALPLSGGEPIGRGELAARYGGARGAHALDDGHRLSALVLRGAAAATGSPYPRTAAERRALWASVGVVCDSISATVVVANLRPEPTNLVARQLCERADARLPTHLTARDLGASKMRIPGGVVHVCENPRILEAALDRDLSAAIVCTAGNPATVTIDLLRQLVESGARIAYRGDFDWPGIAIANRIIDRIGCSTWLFDNQTYAVAVKDVAGDAVPLMGRPSTAHWDHQLSETMQDQGVAIHEELLIDQLLVHLAHAVP